MLYFSLLNYTGNYPNAKKFLWTALQFRMQIGQEIRFIVWVVRVSGGEVVVVLSLAL